MGFAPGVAKKLVLTVSMSVVELLVFTVTR